MIELELLSEPKIYQVNIKNKVVLNMIKEKAIINK